MKGLQCPGRLRVIRAGLSLAIVAMMLLAEPHPGAASIDFATMYRTFPSVPAASQLRVLDANGDGVQDVVVVGSSKDIWFHRGLTGGGYAVVAPLLSFPGTVRRWDVGDLNNDGKLDFVAADGTSTAWSVLANGDGTFQPPRAILTQFGGACLTLGDLDIDGKIDLAAAQPFGPIYILKGTGDGGFQLQSIVVQPPKFPVDLAIADFDGDSIPDVMALDAGTDGPLTARTVNLFHGLGNCSLGERFIIPMPDRPSLVRVADVDQDERPDAMVGNAGGGVTILYGASTGAPLGRLDLPQLANVDDVTAIDIDGDGKLEVIVATSPVTGDRVTILGRTGPRSYTTLRDYAAGPQLGGIGFTDVDRDGNRDLVLCNRGLSRLAVLRGHGGLEFGDGMEVRTVDRMWGLDVGDLNGDSFVDVSTMLGSTSTVGVHLNRGDGSFLPMLSTDGPFACCGLVFSRLADANGDGRPDLIGLVQFYDRLDVVLGDGTGHFGARTFRDLGSQPYAMAVADCNEDGIADVVAACDAGIAICLGTASGRFGAPAFLTGQKKYVRTADFNRDGHADLIATNSHRNYEFGSEVAVFLGRGDGTFSALPTFYAGYRPTNVAVGKINGDAIMDIAVANFGDNSIALFLGRGDGTFVADSVMTSVWGPSLELADLDGDGAQELIAAVPDVAAIRVWQGPVAGRNGPILDFGTLTDPTQLRLADLDHDGRVDLVIERGAQSSFDVLLNRSPSLPTPVLVAVVEARVSAGRVRLLWQLQATALASARVERASGDGWQEVGVPQSEGAERASFEDTPTPGEYDYRLTLQVGEGRVHAGEVHVFVPRDELALGRCIWDAASFTFRATVSLAGSARARLEFINVSGQLVASDSWVPASGGRHEHDARARTRLASGVYWARLSQNGKSVTRQLVVLR